MEALMKDPPDEDTFAHCDHLWKFSMQQGATGWCHQMTHLWVKNGDKSVVLKLCRWETDESEKLNAFKEESGAMTMASASKCGPDVFASNVVSDTLEDGANVSYGFVAMEDLTYDLEALESAWGEIYSGRDDPSRHDPDTQLGDQIRKPEIMTKICTDFNDLLKRLWNECGFVHADLNSKNVRFRLETTISSDDNKTVVTKVTPLLIDYGRIVMRAPVDKQLLDNSLLSPDDAGVDFKYTFTLDVRESTYPAKLTYRDLIDTPFGDGPSDLRTAIQRAAFKLKNNKNLGYLTDPTGKYREEYESINAAVQFCHILEGFSLQFKKGTSDDKYDLEDIALDDQHVTARNFLKYTDGDGDGD
jgi:hypothetical protein